MKQIKVLGERPGSDCGRPENDLAGSDLRAAIPKILALIKDRCVSFYYFTLLIQNVLFLATVLSDLQESGAR